MRNSDKYIIKAVIFFVIGIACIWYLSSDSGLEILNKNPITTLSILALIFVYSGSSQGSARGWHEIELRKKHPEYFENENIKTD